MSWAMLTTTTRCSRRPDQQSQRHGGEDGKINEQDVSRIRAPQSAVPHSHLAAAAHEELLAKGFGPAFVAVGSMASHAHEHGRPFVAPARERVFGEGLAIAILAGPCLVQAVADRCSLRIEAELLHDPGLIGRPVLLRPECNAGPAYWA